MLKCSILAFHIVMYNTVPSVLYADDGAKKNIHQPTSFLCDVFFLFKLGRKVWFSDRRTMRRNARIHSENKRVKMVKRLIICILSTMAFRSATSTLTLITRIHYLCTHKKKCIIIFCANKWRAATTKHTLSQLCEEERKKSCSQCFYLLIFCVILVVCATDTARDNAFLCLGAHFLSECMNVDATNNDTNNFCQPKIGLFIPRQAKIIRLFVDRFFVGSFLNGY